MATGRPLPGANVVLRDSAGAVRGATADGRGFYQISGLPAGRYRLRISHVGYAAARDTLRLEAGAARTYDVALRPAERQLRGVEVTAERSAAKVEASRRVVEPADIQRIPTPGPGGDLASFLRTQPGVAVVGDRGGRLYVRGGTPSQNLVLVDGTPIYRPFHLIGQYSAFPSALVSSADVYAGGFGAQYAGRLSSVIDVRLRPGNKNFYEGSVATSPFLASARIEGPLSRSGKASFVGLFRRSFIERSAPLLLQEEVPIHFHDLTVKGQFGGERNRCSLTLLHTYDRGRIDPGADGARFRWTNNVAAGSCRFLGRRTSGVTDVNVGVAHLSSSVHRTEQSGRSAQRWSVRARISHRRPISWGEVRVGLRARNDQFRYNLDQKFFRRQDQRNFGLTLGGHVGLTWKATEALALKPSLAVRAPLAWGGASLEPRLRLWWAPWNGRAGTLSGALGLYRQSVMGIRDVRDAGAAFMAWVPTPVAGRTGRAVHAVLGWNRRLTTGLTASVAGYHKQMANLPVPKWSQVARFTTALALSDGTAYGVDVRLEWKHAPLRLTLGYGYGRVTYRASREDLGTWIQGGGIECYPPAHDRRHKLSATASADLRFFDANLTWRYGSGRPFTQALGFDSALNIVGVEEHPSRDLGTPRLLYRRPYQARLPAFHRLDVSLQRTVQVSRGVQMGVKLGAINAYDRRNLFYYDLLTLRRVDQLPIVPYLSLRLTFQ